MLQLRLLYLLWIVQQIYNDPQQIKTSEICHTHQHSPPPYSGCQTPSEPASFAVYGLTVYTYTYPCVYSRSGNNDAKSSDGTGSRSSDDPGVYHRGVPADCQLLGEGRTQAEQLGQVPRRRLRRRQS